jgi:TP901 family phage tail tape measure protein
MGERVTAVILEADITKYQAAMNNAANSTRNLAAEGKKLEETHRALTMLGTGMLAAGAAIAAGVGVAIAKYAEFDQAMSNVAATGEDARANMDALRQAALDAGASTVFSATESANAIEELAKAGLSAKDILGGGLKGSLDLAAAGGLEVADAAGIAATALKVFNLRGVDMSHVADLLAAGAGKAMGDVSDLSAALQQGGQVAAATGLTIEETTATLAAFASQGLLGSDAGTSFKTMLQRLTPQSAEAAAKMKELGISAYDAAGNFVGMEKFAGNLQTALKDLTPEQRNAALAVMFGSDAVRAANVVYKEGESGIRNWISAVDDQGYAAEVAATRLDNLLGDWEQFTGALDTAFISMGEGANGPLRDLVQGLTGLVDGFNGLPDGGKQAVLWIGLVTAGVGLLGGATLIAIPKLAAFKIAMETLGVSGATTRAGLVRFASFMTGPWGIALVAATAVIVTIKTELDKLKTSTEVFQNVIKNAKSADELFAASDSALPFLSRIKEATASVEVFQEKLDIINNNKFLLGLDGAASTLQKNLQDIGHELSTMADSDAPAAAQSFRMLTDQMTDSKKGQIDLLNTMSEYRDALAKQATAQGVDVITNGKQIDMNALLAFALSDTTDATGEATQATSELEAATQEAVGELDDMKRALDEVAGKAMDMAAAHDDALGAINALADAAAAEGASLNGTNDASIRFRDSIREVEQAHRDSAEAILANGGTLEQAQGEWQAGRDKVIEMRVAMGESREEAVAWADQNLGSSAQVVGALGNVSNAINNIPRPKPIILTVDTSPAMRGIDQFITQQSNRVIRVRVAADGGSIQMGSFNVSPNENGGLYSYRQFANGGMSSGIYPGGAEIHKFAERTLPWEAYISPKSDQRQQNYGTWLEVGNRLGFSQPQSGSGGAGIINNFTGDVIGQDPREIAVEFNKLQRRANQVAGVRKTVGD